MGLIAAANTTDESGKTALDDGELGVIPPRRLTGHTRASLLWLSTVDGVGRYLPVR